MFQHLTVQLFHLIVEAPATKLGAELVVQSENGILREMFAHWLPSLCALEHVSLSVYSLPLNQDYKTFTNMLYKDQID